MTLDCAKVQSRVISFFALNYIMWLCYITWLILTVFEFWFIGEIGYAILWRSPKNCEEKEHRGIPYVPRLRPRWAPQGSGVNIVYYNFAAGQTTPHGFRLQKWIVSLSLPLNYIFLFVERFPMDLRIFWFIKNRSSRDFGRGIYFAFWKLQFVS